MRGYLFLLTVFGFGCRAAVVAKTNAIPTADITSHEDGDTPREGFAETLQGQVTDADNSNEELEVSWTVGGIDVCPDSAPDEDGLVECEVIFGLGEGSGLVTLTVSDPEGDSATDQVTLDVQATDPPTASITEPTADGIYYSDVATNLAGTVSDTEDAADTLTVQWQSSADGVLEGDFSTPDAEGALAGDVVLSEGEHTISLTVTDSTGKETSTDVTINVGSENSDPTCAITAPESGSAGVEGEEVTFAATVGDVDVSAEWLSVSWESDIDGPLGDSTPDAEGEVSFPIDSLTINTHTITMTVVDEHGLSCTAEVTYTVGTLPMLTVTAPAEGSILNHSEEVLFEATVGDNEDNPNEVTLSWESDVDGVFSDAGSDEEGAVSIAIGTLSPGDHAVTVTATDTHGLSVTDSVNFHLNQPPTTPTVTLGPDPAYTTDTLTAVASGSEDPDESGEVSYQYEWYEDEVLSDASTSDTFPAESTAKNRTYRVVVTPTDGMFDGTSAEAEVAVLNTAPVLSTVSIAPDPAYNDDTLVCSASATDADDDDATITYEWTGGATGAELPLTSIIAASGDTLECTATVDDGDGGTDTATASVTIGNRAPSVTASIEPAAPTKNDTLICVASESADPDDDATTLSFTWTVAGTPMPASSTSGIISTLTAAFVAGQTVACTIDIDDGKGGTDTNTASVEVLNTPPEVTEVTLSPESVYTNDTVTAAATTTDTDDDTVTVTYAFSVDGDVVQDGSSNTLDGAVHFDKGQTITVAVTADDTRDSSTATSEGIVVRNSTPESPSVSLDLAEQTLPTGDYVAQFNGSSPISAPSMDIGSSGTRTMMAWVRPDEFAEMKIFGLGGDPNMVLKSNPAGHLVVQCAAGTQSVADILTPDVWTHVAATWQANTIRLYANGVRVFENSSLSCPIDDTAMYIGAALASHPFPWRGAIEEVKVWAARLSDAEVADEMETGLARTDDVRAYYPLDEGEGTAIDDASDSGRDATHPQGTWIELEETVTNLVCSVDLPSADADGDTIDYIFEWDVDESPYTDTDSTVLDGDTVHDDAIGYDETWTCTVTPNDGEHSGASASASFTTEADSLCVAGDETFTTETLGAGREVLGAVIEDIDGDGHMDVAVNEQLDNKVRIYWGDGSGVFGGGPQTIVGIGRSGARGDIEDIDGDGHMDLVWGSQDANRVWVVMGAGGRTFEGATSFSQSGGPNQIKLLDLNGDGHQDALVRDRFGSCMRRLFGHGDGTFGASSCFLSNGNVDGGDIDGDGLIELLMRKDGALTRYDLDADGNVSSESLMDTSVLPSAGEPHLIDMDFDDDLDLVMFNSDTIAAYQNDGLGNFEGCVYAVDAPHYMQAVGFLNDDDLIDYASFDTCSYCTSEVHFVIHEESESSTSVCADTGFTFDFDGSTPSELSINGDAFHNTSTNTLQLATSGVTYDNNSVFLTERISGDLFYVSFDSNMVGSSDGVAFTFGDETDPTFHTPDYPYAVNDFDGYMVVFDTFHNALDPGTGDFVGLRKIGDDWPYDLLSYDTSIPNLNDGVDHNYEISMDSGRLQVAIDGTDYIDYDIPDYDYDEILVGWGGHNGGLTGTVTIDNLVIDCSAD